MKSLINRFKTSEAGNTIVEFALLAPLFFIVVFGMIDIGRLYWTVSSMEYAVEAAGRYAMINTSATSNQVISQAQANLYAINQNSVTFTTSTSTSGGINYMTIKAQNSFSFLPSAMFSISILTLTRASTIPLLP